MAWKKKTFYNDSTQLDYRLEHGGYKIDVNKNKDKRAVTPYQIQVFGSNYGGWLFGGPQNFKTAREANQFVKSAKQNIKKGKHGKRIAWLP
jgi:hypothetical protein